jgi:hypothetical protein
MNKRTSERRWKARFAIGKWIPMEAVLNWRLEYLVKDAEVHPYACCFRRRSA